MVFKAIEHLRADLPALVRTARARPASRWAAPPWQQRYLGAGPVQIRLRPAVTEADVLGQVFAELGGQCSPQGSGLEREPDGGQRWDQ